MDLERVLQNIPPHANEAIVEQNISKSFLKASRVGDLEILPQFLVGRKAVDQAARKNSEDDLFLHTGNNPFLYMEVKGRTENLTENQPDYARASGQLKQYLLDPKSTSVQWGILTNSVVAQVFRKHGKVVHAVTPCLSFEAPRKLIRDIKNLIEKPRRALVIAVYNNKGGGGKTTTTLNLAINLANFLTAGDA